MFASGFAEPHHQCAARIYQVLYQHNFLSNSASKLYKWKSHMGTAHFLKERKFLFSCGVKNVRERFLGFLCDIITWRTRRNLLRFSCWVEPKSCHEYPETSAFPRPAGLWCLYGTTCTNTHQYLVKIDRWI